MLERTTPPNDILLRVVDDYEEAPWLVMADAQGWAVNHFASTLDTYALRQQPPWYVATLLPVSYWSRRANARKVASPDAFMARVARRHRESYNVELERKPPAFVLEVVSPDSVYRDTVEKQAIYEEMGVLEYALFSPPIGLDEDEAWLVDQEQRGILRSRRRRRRRWPIDPPLQGWHRDESTGQFVPWSHDQITGPNRLWSEELGLWLAVRGDELGLQLPNGAWLLTHEEEATARAQEAAARMQEAEARRSAEAEVERLRAELEHWRQFRGQDGSDDHSAEP